MRRGPRTERKLWARPRCGGGPHGEPSGRAEAGPGGGPASCFALKGGPRDADWQPRAALLALIPLATLALGAASAHGTSGGRLVYGRLVGQSELWSIPPSGKSWRRLTQGQLDRFPAVSPDGKRIAFSRHVDGWQLFVENVDGGGLRQLTSDGDSNLEPTWSPDGTTIAFMRSGSGEQSSVWTVHPDGSHLREVAGAGDDEAPAWSPDSKSLLIARGRLYCAMTLEQVAADGSASQGLVESGVAVLESAWSPS